MTEPILTPFLGGQDITVYRGDCIEVMRQMPENSVDAIVTDPPYGLEFMGKDWDGFGTPLGFQTWTEAWAREAFRVLKPGGHLLAFAGTRTYHRMASGVEDAGFEIRDCIAWMYGSGFPKSLDVSKAIDKAAGAKREVVGTRHVTRVLDVETLRKDNYAVGVAASGGEIDVTAPATPDAEKWNGWGTALKPAFEPIVVARKPLIGTVAKNVLEHGTGALNIDGCRIGWANDSDRRVVENARFVHDGTRAAYGDYASDGETKSMRDSVNTAGRWPANVTLDEDAAAMLDEQTPNLAKAWSAPSSGNASDRTYGGSIARSLGAGHMPQTYGDSGGASRFFYTAKASKKDRNTNGANNTHPTVKPAALMRWLIRLVTPPGGIILDPFGGSGSTGVAARAEGVRCILIEREADYLDIIRQRLDEGPLFSNLD
jgi:DNA modification methylase